MSQMAEAKRGRATPEIKAVARQERIAVSKLTKLVAAGRAIIARSKNHEEVRPVGIGEGLSTKVNANLGTSPDFCDVDFEIKKARTAVKYGADTVMDLSTAGSLSEIRKTIMKAARVPLGTVPVYETAVESARGKRSIVDMTEDDMFRTIEEHARDGVDFMTIHCGVTKSIIDRIVEHPRLMGIVSRGGTFLACWILYHGQENPLYENFDGLLEIAKEYDFTISLGDGLRPGCIFDATDWSQMQELLTIGELVKRARKSDVQVMVEGPGHLPLDHIASNVKLEKSICDGAPFYVLGPVVTEIAAGYDHIVGAIGGSIAGMAGADFLCVVTPSEHLGLPDVDDIKLGVVAAKIAAHASDVVKLGDKTSKADRELAKARAKLDWSEQMRFLIDPERAQEIRNRVKLRVPDTCSMCGRWCAIKTLQAMLKTKAKCV